jgi:hypothetical protein
MARRFKKKPASDAGDDARTVETDWPQIFDVLAHEYGWTFDQVGRLSFREIDWCLRQIGRRKHEDRAFQARLAGFETKPLPHEIEQDPTMQVSDEERAASDKMMEETLARKREQFRGRHHHQNSR